MIEHLNDHALLRNELSRHLETEYNAWSGIAALLVANDGFPLGKIPVLCCQCANEYCGYVACSVSVEPRKHPDGLAGAESETVVVKDFGVLYPYEPALASVSPEAPTEDIFIPLMEQPVFVFDRAQYERALTELLELDPLAISANTPKRIRIRRSFRNLFSFRSR